MDIEEHIENVMAIWDLQDNDIVFCFAPVMDVVDVTHPQILKTELPKSWPIRKTDQLAVFRTIDDRDNHHVSVIVIVDLEVLSRWQLANLALDDDERLVAGDVRCVRRDDDDPNVLRFREEHAIADFHGDEPMQGALCIMRVPHFPSDKLGVGEGIASFHDDAVSAIDLDQFAVRWWADEDEEEVAVAGVGIEGSEEGRV